MSALCLRRLPSIFAVTRTQLNVNVQSRRTAFAFLDHVWNKVDENRIKEVGPEVAAAEWLLRCGASIKWQNHEKYLSDYNQIGLSRGPNAKIEGIDATDSCIMAEGFEYFKQLSAVKTVKFHKTYNINDAALAKLHYLGKTLENVEVSSCGDVTDIGVKDLSTLKKLKDVYLFDLPGVKNADDCVTYLQSKIPDCKVEFRSSRK